MLLGYGMVVLLMEDVKRDVDAAHAELAVAHDALKRLALHDSLTGVLNRRAWTEGIGLEAVRASFGTRADAGPGQPEDGERRARPRHRRRAPAPRGRGPPCRRAPHRPPLSLGGDEFLLLLPGARAVDARRRVDELVARANAAIPADSAGCCSSAWAPPSSRAARRWSPPSAAPTPPCTRRSSRRRLRVPASSERKGLTRSQRSQRNQTPLTPLTPCET